jgi:Uma2 family endonuclease
MATSATAINRMTAEDFCDFVHRPENDNRWFELVRGEVIEMPPPQKPHGIVQGNTARLLGNYTLRRR